MSFSSGIFFLSETERLLLIDGYSRKYKYNHQYIPIELCKIISKHITFYFDFFIIFEKSVNDDVNELVCYDLISKSKIIKNNNLWKRNFGTSYCIYKNKTINDYLIYRIGGENNNIIPNIQYSIKHDIHIELPFSQIIRQYASTQFNTLYGLITIGGCDSNYLELSNVEIMNDKKQWKYLESMNESRSRCSSTTFENKLFVFGGWKNKTSEMYSFENNNWINLTEMKNQRRLNGIKYFEMNKKIILIGGYNNEVCKSFEMFDIVKNEFIEYPQTFEEHRWRPGISIENNNLIYYW